MRAERLVGLPPRLPGLHRAARRTREDHDERHDEREGEAEHEQAAALALPLAQLGVEWKVVRHFGKAEKLKR